MDEVRKLEAQELARARARSRRRRVAIIRRRTIRGSLALFAILWGVVFVQLAAGDDPALSNKHRAERRSAAGPGSTTAKPVREPAPEVEAGLDGSGFEIEEGQAAEFDRIRIRTGIRRTARHLLLLTAVGPHLFWVTSRAAGIAAMMLASGSLGVGVLIRSRGAPRRLHGGDVRALHEALSLATLAAIAIHGTALLGDAYLHPGPLDIAIPFTGAYRPFWTGLGIVSAWGLAALGVSYYARRRIGAARWRGLHRFIPIFWALGIVHTLGAGTDAAQPWMLLAIGLPAAPALLLLTGRLLGSPDAEPRARRPAEPRLSARRG